MLIIDSDKLCSLVHFQVLYFDTSYENNLSLDTNIENKCEKVVLILHYSDIECCIFNFQHRHTADNNPDTPFEFSPENIKVSVTPLDNKN